MLVWAGIAVAAALGLLVGCQSRLIYFPRPYASGAVAEWKTATGGEALDYTTAAGKQRAWLMGDLKQPKHLWIVCGGNASLALEWSSWLRAHGPPGDAWLLVDFPGYGDCQGSCSPARVRESLRAVVPLAAARVGWSLPADERKLRFFGHSLGAGVALAAASDLHIRRGVVLAPFTSTMDMARRVIGLPVGFLVWHRFDNSARLDEIGRLDGARVIIVHGTDDEVIPVAMGRALAEKHSGFTTLREVPGGHHNDVQEIAADTLAEALREADR